MTKEMWLCEASPSNEALTTKERPLTEGILCVVSSTSTPFSDARRKCGEGQTISQPIAQFYRSMPSLKRLLQIQFFFFLSTVSSGAGIGCFVCSSFNKSNPECEDPFNSTISSPMAAASTANNYQVRFYKCCLFCSC